VVVPINVSAALYPIAFITFPGVVLPRYVPILPSPIISPVAIMIPVPPRAHFPDRFILVPEPLGKVTIDDRLPRSVRTAAPVPTAILAGIIAIAVVDQVIGDPHHQGHPRTGRQYHERGRGHGHYRHHRQGQAKVDRDTE
jgi:hypothetical protein